MQFPTQILCHDTERVRPSFKVDWVPGRATDPDGQQRPWQAGELTCSYCGSLHPRALYRILKQRPPSGTFEWADRKHGWPHKLYLPFPYTKFYSKHMHDFVVMTDAFKALNDELARVTGISFFFNGAGGLGWVMGDALFRASCLAKLREDGKL
jgi:hypothetical protein